MYLVLHNIESGALLAKRITDKVNRADFTVSYAHDIFSAVEKVINIYIENNFNHNLDDVELLLSEAIQINKHDVIKAIRKSFIKYGELVRIMLEETEHSSLTRFLILPSEKGRAIEMTKRQEMSIKQMILQDLVF